MDLIQCKSTAPMPSPPHWHASVCAYTCVRSVCQWTCNGARLHFIYNVFIRRLLSSYRHTRHCLSWYLTWAVDVCRVYFFLLSDDYFHFFLLFTLSLYHHISLIFSAVSFHTRLREPSWSPTVCCAAHALQTLQTYKLMTPNDVAKFICSEWSAVKQQNGEGRRKKKKKNKTNK